VWHSVKSYEKNAEANGSVNKSSDGRKDVEKYN